MADIQSVTAEMRRGKKKEEDRTHTHTTILRLFFRDQLGEPVPEENFLTLWCKGRLTEADTPTIRLGTTPSGLTSAHLHHPAIEQTTEQKYNVHICYAGQS